MSQALRQYKDLVDQLRDLCPSSAKAQVNSIDEQLKKVWADLCENERVEAEAYWRQSTTMQTARPHGLN